MDTQLTVCQQGFLELHASLAEPAAAAQIRELVAVGVSVERILALYPFTPGGLARTLRGHLNSQLRLNSFVALVEVWSQHQRRTALHDGLDSAHSFDVRQDWRGFYNSWQGRRISLHLSLDGNQARYFALYDTFELMWMGARWRQLPELHEAGADFAWASTQLGQSLRFTGPEGLAVVNGAQPL